LDPQNPSFDELRAVLRVIRDEKFSASVSKFKFCRKAKNLPELFQTLLKQGNCPLVDKRLRLVILPSSHEWLRGVLYCYHNKIKFERARRHEYADLYVKSGLGFYKSGVDEIVVDFHYRADNAERDLFMALGLKRFE